MGFPKENSTAQGSNCMSTLLNEVCKLLNISPLQKIPYQLGTDGLMEYFNQTPKQMVRKFVISEPKYWNKLIPFVYFAYWDVSQSSTDLSSLKFTKREFPIRANQQVHTSLRDEEHFNDVGQMLK